MLLFVTMLLALNVADEEKISKRPDIIQMHFLGTKKRTKNKRKPLALDEECCRMAQKWQTTWRRLVSSITVKMIRLYQEVIRVLITPFVVG